MLETLAHPRSLDQAWEKVRANGGCSGGDGLTIPAFQQRAAQNLIHLSQDLKDSTYAPGPLRQVDIPKRKGGTRRLLIPSLTDRIVHTALANMLTPILDPMFEASSFAYRPGRSVKQAVQAIGKWRTQGYWHVIEADIVGFFDAVRHDLLLTKLEATLTDVAGHGDLIALVGHWLEHQAQQTGRQGRGLAQGSPLSPMLANLYLDAFDEAIEGKGVRIVRFADDFVVLCKKRDTAEDALHHAKALLAEHGLELHPKGTGIVDFDRGFEFLGHLFVRSMTLQHISDPEDDPVHLLRTLAGEDARAAKEAADLAEAVQKEKKAGYDRGARVLYLTEPGRSLTLRNLSFAVENASDTEIAAIAHGRVDRIEIGPGARIDPAALEHAVFTDTDLAFVDGFGETRGEVRRPSRDRAALHLAQARAVLDPTLRLEFARRIVDARIRNQRTQLFRLNRKKDLPEVVAALARMGRHLRKLPSAASVEQLLGLEGAVGAEYWPALFSLCDGAEITLKRSRPAKDPLNAAINYLTAMLGRDIRAAMVSAGLHSGFGVLHSVADRADAGVYDMMEPFRAPLTEGLAVFLFNAKRLRPGMFHMTEDGQVRIEQPARRAIITGYESAIARRVNVTGAKLRLAWRPMMRRQAKDLGTAARAESPDAFHPYLMEA